jgi:DNA-binding transcriptional ArsR family regulator
MSKILSQNSLIEHNETIANLFAVLANPKRLHILHILTKEEMSVGLLAEKVGLSQSALSQHLARCRSLKLVSTRRDAQSIYYRSESNVAHQLFELLERLASEEEFTGRASVLRNFRQHAAV